MDYSCYSKSDLDGFEGFEAVFCVDRNYTAPPSLNNAVRLILAGTLGWISFGIGYKSFESRFAFKGMALLLNC